MTAVNIRFMLSGACHPYSGRQVLFAIPLHQTDESPSTIGNVKGIIRRCWPSSELPSVAQQIQSVGLRILKSGKLLSDDQFLKDVLNTSEIQESGTTVQTSGSGFDDTTQSVAKTVLMHLVFQQPLTAPSATTPVVTEDKKAVDPKTTASSDSGCCAMM